MLGPPPAITAAALQPGVARLAAVRLGELLRAVAHQDGVAEEVEVEPLAGAVTEDALPMAVAMEAGQPMAERLHMVERHPTGAAHPMAEQHHTVVATTAHELHTGASTVVDAHLAGLRGVAQDLPLAPPLPNPRGTCQPPRLGPTMHQHQERTRRPRQLLTERTLHRHQVVRPLTRRPRVTTVLRPQAIQHKVGQRPRAMGGMVLDTEQRLQRHLHQVHGQILLGVGRRRRRLRVGWMRILGMIDPLV
jgi:hypothetical protein